MLRSYCLARKGTRYRQVSVKLEAAVSAITNLEDVVLDSGNSRGEEDDGEKGNTAEHASLDAAI